MKFETNESREMALRLMGVQDSPDQDFLEVYLKGKEDYFSRVRSWSKSQKQKHNWRKHRFKYQAGIDRYHRKTQGLFHKRILSAIKGKVKENGTVECKLPEYIRYQFLEAISDIRTILWSEASFFTLEEAYLERAEWTDIIGYGIGELERAIITEAHVPYEVLECLLVMIPNDDLDETFGEGFSSTILEEESITEALKKVQ